VISRWATNSAWPLRACVRFWNGPSDLPRALETERRLWAIRWLGIVLMAPSLGLLNLDGQRLMAAYLVLAVAAIYNAAVHLCLKRHSWLFTRGYFTTIGDALLNVAMITLGGGFGTPLYFLLYTVTIASAMRYGSGPALAVSLCFVGFDGLQHVSEGSPPDGPFMVRSGFLLLTGILASYLKEQAKRAEHALQVQLHHATHAALHDRLTGLPNRTLLTERIEQALEESRATFASVAVLFIDLDHFKEVNDTFGHRFGDLVLQEVGRRLEVALPPAAMLARLSGDEFAVLLPGADASTATQFAAALLDRLDQPLQVEDLTVDVGGSIGISIAPEHGTEADLLQRRADVAMYSAKSRRNDYAIYTPDQDKHSRHRLELASDLKRAIERGELRLHYQPIVSLRTGRMEEVEALVRWQHPTRGLISPSEFIPLAEETGAILPIGRWVLDEACRQAAEWRADYSAAASLTMSVNLSARQFQHVDVTDEVRAALQQSGLDPRYLKLEITESVAMVDPELSIASLWVLKGLGIRLAIDDFGTGYSSLGYLKRFPADTLKIDKVFIDGLGMNPEDGAIVAAAIAFARAVGLSTTAEGVEHSEQLEHLRELGADRVQGYLCAKPLPARDIAGLLSAPRRLAPADQADLVPQAA
jgi:diguanylate cyclase (GGDEF)-like protein